MKKSIKVVLGVVISIIVIVVLLISYIKIKYSKVDSSFRLKGTIMDTFVKFDDRESLIKASKMYSKLKPKVPENINVEEVMTKRSDGNDIRVLIYKGKNSTKNASGML